MTNRKKRAYNIKNVFARRDKLVALIEKAKAAGGSVPPAVILEFIFSVVPKANYSAAHQTATIADISTPLTTRNFAWAVAGNADLLQDGVAVTPFKFTAETRTLPVAVVAVDPVNRPNGMVYSVRCKVLAGPGCPGEFVINWKSRSANYIATHPKGLGFSRLHRRPFKHYRQLVSLRFLVEVTCVAAAPRGGKVKVTPSFRSHNIATIDMRFRRGFSCPNNYSHHCHECHIGYKTCPAGTHADDYVLGVCSSCGKPDCWLVKGGRCETCQAL